MNGFGLKVRNGSVKLGGLTAQGTKEIPKANAINVVPVDVSNKNSVTGISSQFFTTRGLPNQITQGAASSPIRPVKDFVKAKPVFIRPQPITEPKAITADSLYLNTFGVGNGNFETQVTKGISPLRPEIISCVDWQPIYKSGQSEFSSAGSFLYSAYQMRRFKHEIVKKIIESLDSNQRTTKLASQVIDEKNLRVTEIENDLRFLNANVKQIQSIKKAFEIKAIPTSYFAGSNFLSIPDFFDKRMLYSNESFDIFSDTKIMLQMIFDARSMMETYSISLLNSADSDRGNSDRNPTALDKTYRDKSQVSFVLSGFSGKYGYVENNIRGLLSALPSNNTDKLKLLLSSISKELRVSRGLSKPSVRKRLSDYYGGSADGNPFDNIFGSVGNDIFEIPQGTNSLASLFVMKNANVTILPWENRLVDDGQTTYIPGNLYFLDTILKLTKDQKFNTQPFEDYTQLFSDILSNASQTLGELLEFQRESSISSNGIVKAILEGMRSSYSTIGNANTQNQNQLLLGAIFSLANSDFKLRVMLFQFVLLLGMALSKEDQRKIFERICDEVGNLVNLNYLQFTTTDTALPKSGMEAIYPLLVRFADDIEAYILQLISPTTLQNLVGNSTSAPGVAQNIRSATTIVGDNSVREMNSFQAVQPGVLENNTNIKSVINSLNKKSDGEIDVISEIPFQIGSIKQALLNAATSTGTSILGNVIKETLEISHVLDTAASISGNDRSYVLGTDGSTSAQATVTRFNQITSSMIVFMIFEALVVFTGSFFEINLKRNSPASSPYININQSKNAYVLSIIDDILQQISSSNSNANLSVKSSPSMPSANSGLSTSSKTVGEIVGNTFQSLPANNGSFVKSNVAAARTNTELSSLIQVIAPGKNKSLIGQGRINSGGSSISNQTSTAKPSEAIVSNSTKDSSLKNMFSKAFASSISDIQKAVVVNQKIILKYASIKGTIEQIRAKVAGEDEIIQNVIYIFDVLAKQLVSKKNETLQYFTEAQQTLTSGGVSAYGINLLGSKQLQLSNWLLLESKEKQAIDENELNSLFSMCKLPIFSDMLAGKRTKLLAVGLPANISEKLLDRVNRNEIDSSFEKTKESDVVTVNVYKRSSEDDDIIFYPQKFHFDLSLFKAKPNGLQINPLSSFEVVSTQLGLVDMSADADVGSNRTIVGRQELDQDKWSFLSTEDKDNLFRNHLISDLLALYTRLMTNISIKEDTFLQEQLPMSVTDNPSLQVLARVYLIEKYKIDAAILEGVTTWEQFSHLDIPVQAKEEVKILLGSKDFYSAFLREKVLGLKKFDRVFFIPINVDSFVINEEATKQTQSGKNAMSDNNFQRKLSKTADDNQLLYKDRSREPNALILEEYFVTIETARK